MQNIEIESGLIEQLIEISKEAGKAILKVYSSDFDHQIKEDLSPLTKADTISHNIICQRLKILTPDIPILSEEGSNIPNKVRSKWKQYWLVDPLDGTKEFLKRNGEFTVNIALIENNNPILGVVHLPVSDETYWGSNIGNSFYSKGTKNAIKISVQANPDKRIRILASRSHPSKLLDSFLREITDYQIFNRGSSLKFCLIASGQADIYPRFGPTSEWDTAAGHAVLKFAGGKVIDLKGEELSYNKRNLINPDFIAISQINLSLITGLTL